MTDAHESITCLIVDDHPVIVDALSTVLAANGISVVGTAPDAGSALQSIGLLKPRVAVIDLTLSGSDGMELVRRVVGVSPETSVVVYTARSEPGLLYEALDSGARGFVVKDSPIADLLRSIQLVARGGMFLDPVLAGEMTIMRDRTESDPLTARQVQIMRLLSEGKQDGDIADQLCISVETVRAHVKRAMGRLSAHTRSQAVAEAMRRSYIA